MKKSVIICILSLLPIFLALEGFSQNGIRNEEITEFKNQGEQEDYWAKKFFQREYKEFKYETFAGKITNSNNVFIFEKDTITVSNSDDEMWLIFAKGLLYPEIIGGNLEVISSRSAS